MSFSLVRQLGTRLPVSVVISGPPRTYASKAGRAATSTSTASFVPGSQQRFGSDDENARAEYAKAESKITAAVDWFRREVAALETRASGRVTPALLSPVRVERARGGRAGGAQTTPVKLEEVATVGVKDGSALIVTVFDEHNTKAVEQGIYAAKLPHVVPQRVDARTIKIPIPKPTVEARNAFAASAGRMAEDVRVQIRKHHQASVKRGKYEKRSVELEEFRKLSDKHIAEVDKILAQIKKSTASK